MTALIVIALCILFTAHDVVIGPLDEPLAYDEDQFAERARREGDE